MEHENEIIVSIIIPVYNKCDFVEKCINSCLNQTLKEIEIILVNDGSTDGSEEKCKRFATDNSNVVYLEKENGGLSSARNMGISFAKGNYISFVDSDDTINKDFLERMVYECEINSVEICSSNISSVNHRNDKSVEVCSCNAIRKYLELDDVSVCSKIFSNRLLNKELFSVGSIAEDIDFCFRMFLKVNKFAHINEQFYNVTKCEDSISRSVLKISDYAAIEFSLRNMNMLCSYDKETYSIAKVRYLENVFNILNKGVNFGFQNLESERFYKEKYPSMITLIRKNIFTLLKNKHLRTTNKMQMFVMAVSFKLFKKLKRMFLKNEGE